MFILVDYFEEETLVEFFENKDITREENKLLLIYLMIEIVRYLNSIHTELRLDNIKRFRI